MGNRRQRNRQGTNCHSIGEKPAICGNCGEMGFGHFCPPCFGEAGFYSCEKLIVEPEPEPEVDKMSISYYQDKKENKND
jgi:hypothetical protein